MFHRALISLLLLITTFNTVWSETQSFLLPANARFIFPASKGASLLQQCSRRTPTDVSSFWEPSPKDIERLEQLLVGYLSDRENSRAGIPPKGLQYHRQYVGIVKAGVRMIYGNFYIGGKPQDAEKTAPAIICDGGTSHWGVVFNIQTGEFEELEFNGVA
jgi:hypothetical protein